VRSGDPRALPPLRTALADEDAVVRGHAAWAIGRIDPRDPALDRALRREADEQVRTELIRAVES
jgi:epoxyqueuosine reductase